VAEIGQGGGRLNIRRQAVPEDGCSNANENHVILVYILLI